MGVELEEEKKKSKLRIMVAQFILIDGLLYKRPFSIPYLRCLTLVKAEYAMREIHERICSNHLKTHALAHKLIQS